MSTASLELPRWDLDPIFPGLSSDKFRRAWASVQGQIADLKAFLDERRVTARPADGNERETFHALVERLNRFNEALEPLYAYVLMLVDADSADEEAQARLSELEIVFLEYRKLRPRITAWLGGLDIGAVEPGDYRLMLEEAKVEAAHQMSEPEELLAAELSLSGSRAWVKLHSNLTSQITAVVGGEELPITAVRNLANHPDEATRRAAYQAELGAWKASETALAAALNGYKGQVSTLNRRRGWGGDLAPALLENRVSAATLEAMQAAMEGSFPHFRRYFRAKAAVLGKGALDWWDLFAPLGKAGGEWGWEAGRDFIAEHLSGFSKDAAELAERSYAENWTDAAPRKGKVGGAYCMHVGGGASRILANYESNFEWVATMAHELGHAYHNHCLRHTPPLLQTTPSTLAETASIMNETVIYEAALKALDGPQQLAVLEGSLQNAAQVIVDIHSRFLFESGVFAGRAERELSASEFCDLMTQAQDRTYGDGLASRHPYMWAVKGHYYGANFYNFPYAFGLLFGLALYRRYQQEGQGFVARYDQLLASVGKFDAQQLGRQFGFDLETREFWEGGIAVLVGQIDRFERLAGGTR